MKDPGKKEALEAKERTFTSTLKVALVFRDSIFLRRSQNFQLDVDFFVKR